MTGELVPAATLDAPREPVGWPAHRLRDAIRARELGVLDVVRAHLDRLDEVEPWLNAASCVRREAAAREAAAMDRGGPPAGALAGVPITVKDILATAGTPTRCGSAAFAGNVPAVDAVAVARLRAAGAIVIAKSNCPEFAFGVTTESEAQGVTRSPWGAHSPGGSSGGEAALVSCGASALGIGTDYGGSLRWPAQCCGLVALRPGVGAVDGTGQLPERGGRMDGYPGTAAWPDTVQRRFQVIGPIARTVEDLLLAMATIGDTAPALPDADVAVAWVGAEDSQLVGPDAAGALELAVAALAGAGVDVAEAPGALDGLHAAFNDLRDTDDFADLVAALGPDRPRVGLAAARALAAAPISRADPIALRKRIAGLRGHVSEVLRRRPVLVAPVAPVAACSLDGTATVGGTTLGGFALMAQCRAVSALGFPALSIPVARDRHGLPLSVQVVAGPGGEGLALGVGLLLERLLGGRQEPPWRSRVT